MNILLSFLNLREQNASLLFTALQFLRYRRYRNDLLNFDLRVTMQAIRGMKMLPVQAGQPFPAKGGECF